MAVASFATCGLPCSMENIMQTKILTLALVSSLAAGMFAVAPMASAAAPQDNDNTTSSGDTINCQMDFTLSGWSAFYKTANGHGTVTCDNGQSMNVELDVKGGGLTAGAYKINDGHGNFNGVHDIQEILGSYAQATAHAGAVKSSHAAVLTKNNVTLTLAGTGNGWNVGVGFSGFTIKKASDTSHNAEAYH